MSLLMLLLLLAACGQGNPSTQLSSSPAKTTPPNSSPSLTGTLASSTSLLVQVKEVPGSKGVNIHYSFSPSILTVNAGDIVTLINESDATHALISTPAGGITDGSILDAHEIQAVQFFQPGSFTISSQGHPEAKLSATVKGSTSNILPPQMVVLSEKQGSYFFTPNDIGVDVGYGLLFVNQTNETQILIITPSQGVVEGSIIDKNETQLLQFSAELNYTVSSKDHPEATMMVCSD